MEAVLNLADLLPVLRIGLKEGRHNLLAEPAADAFLRDLPNLQPVIFPSISDGVWNLEVELLCLRDDVVRYDLCDVRWAAALSHRLVDVVADSDAWIMACAFEVLVLELINRCRHKLLEVLWHEHLLQRQVSESREVTTYELLCSGLVVRLQVW